MKQIRIRINDLIDRHKDDFNTCKGCPICTRIKLLSKQLQRDSAEKFQYVLNKGSDMTKSDIAFLLENGVPIRKIRDYAGIPHLDFYEMMNNYGFSKKCPQKGRKQEMVQASLEAYQDLKAQGKSDAEISRQFGIKQATLIYYKKKWAMNEVQPDTVEVKPSECDCTKEDKSAEYERIINEQNKTIAEQIRNQEKLNKIIDDYENVNAACEDIENEIASLREENERYFKQQHHDSYIIENQKYQLGQYAKENEKLQEENKALKFFARRYLAVE